MQSDLCVGTNSGGGWVRGGGEAGHGRVVRGQMVWTEPVALGGEALVPWRDNDGRKS